MLRSKKGGQKGVVQNTWTILYENILEHPEKGVVQIPGERAGSGRLPKEFPSTLRGVPPFRYLAIADVQLLPLMESSAKTVPLGQGEAVWVSEGQRNFGIESTALTARHYPTKTGVLIAFLHKEDLQAIFRARPSIERVAALPLLLAHAAKTLGKRGFAVFLRENYLWLAMYDGQEVVDVVFLPGTYGWDGPALTSEINMQKNLIGGQFEEVLFLASPVPAGFSAPSVSAKRFEEINFPPELFWTKPAEIRGALLPGLYAAGAAAIIGLAAQAFLATQIAALERELAALEAEAASIRAQLQAEGAIKSRIAELNNILKNTSTESPLFKVLEDVVAQTPNSVLLSDLLLNDKEVRLKAHSLSVEGLSILAAGVQKVTTSPPASFRVEKDTGDWKTGELSVPLGTAGGQNGKGQGQ